MKVYVVTSYTWYDEYGDGAEKIEGVFTEKKNAQKYIDDEKKKNGKNTESQGTDYQIEEKELDATP